MDEDGSLLERDPIEFYLKKKVPMVDKQVGKYLMLSAGLLFILTLAVAGAIFWYVLRQDAAAPENYAYNRAVANSAFNLNIAARMPRFQSKDQKSRLSEARILSIEPDRLVVYGDGKRTTIMIDEKFVVDRKGDSVPLEIYQKRMDRYLSIIRFAQLNALYISPDPYERKPASIDDLRVDQIVNVVPTNDSPDGDTIKGQSIIILN